MTRSPMTLKLAACAAVLLALALGNPAAQASDSFQIRSISVSAAQPGKGDEARILSRKRKLDDKSADPSPVYLVKLYADLPPASARGYRVFFGEEAIREYGFFAGGVFFKVYHRGDLRRLAGQPLRIGLGREEPKAAGRDFPEEPELEPVLAADQKSLGSVAEILSR